MTTRHPDYDRCVCGHFRLDHTDHSGCLDCQCQRFRKAVEVGPAEFGSLEPGTEVLIRLKGVTKPITGAIVRPYTLDVMPGTVVRTGHPHFPEVAVQHHTVERLFVLKGDA